MDKLSYNQRETAEAKGFTCLDDFDLEALLRIVDKSWYMMREVAYLPTKERECIRDMMRVRNNWTHCSAVHPGKDTSIADLDTLHQFFEQMEADDKLVRQTQSFVRLFLIQTEMVNGLLYTARPPAFCLSFSTYFNNSGLKMISSAGIFCKRNPSRSFFCIEI